MESLRYLVSSQVDVEKVRREVRVMATSALLGETQVEQLAVTVSELATNLLRYAKDGEILLSVLEAPDGVPEGIEVESRDQGPGIARVDLAMEDGYSTGGGLGSGLPAARRMMDEFSIESSPKGTRIVARKWKKSR